METAIWLTEVAPGLTIRDRLRVLQPNDPDSYYQSRELVPNDMLGDIAKTKIVITNYHAFKLRERIDLSKGGRSLLQGRGEALDTLETEGQMIQRVMPDLMGPSITKTAGIIGEEVDLGLTHLADLRASTLLFHVTRRLLYTRWRDPGQEPKLHLFGQLKRITKGWLDTCLVCTGGTYAAQLMYQELAEMACERITAAITRSLVGERLIKAEPDPFNPTGSTLHVNFTTSKLSRWQANSQRCHVNWRRTGYPS